MARTKILVVDDEEELRELVAKYLGREGMEVIQAHCGRKALECIAASEFDLVVLDIMMKDLDGFEVLRRIRKIKPYLPVLFLSARQEDYDKVLGFGLGADDYVTKPFSPAELTARIKAHIRRNSALKQQVVQDELYCGQLKLNLNTYAVTKGEHALELSATELKMLKFFMENPNRVFTKVQIYRNVWGEDFYDDNSVMVYISHLREKIEDNPKNPQLIKTIRGIGYQLVKE